MPFLWGLHGIGDGESWAMDRIKGRFLVGEHRMHGRVVAGSRFLGDMVKTRMLLDRRQTSKAVSHIDVYLTLIFEIILFMGKNSCWINVV